MRSTLNEAFDQLLSIKSTPANHAAALKTLESFARLALDDRKQAELNAYIKLQSSFDYNVCSVLLEWLGRTIAIQSLEEVQSHDPEILRNNLTRCLNLMQGLLLLHRSSQRVFTRACSIEYLLAVLDLSRPSHVSSPLLATATPSPSPVVFSPNFPSPVPSPSNLSEPRTAPFFSQSTSTTPPTTSLSLAALDALLCAVVDRPVNMRTFESVGGLGVIVKVLKNKTVAQPVRIKVIEILYYFMLPEVGGEEPNDELKGKRTNSHQRSESSDSIVSAVVENPYNPTENLPDLLESAAGNFVPQTPIKPKTEERRQRHRRNGSTTNSESDNESPTRNGARKDRRSGLLIRETQLDSHTVHVNGRESEDEGTPKASKMGQIQFKNGATPRSGVGPHRSKIGNTARTTRSVAEKKELLRAVMPNVDALQERFHAMGLGARWT